MTTRIGALEWQTAGEVLGGDASHFTPWLSENLDRLGDPLGVDGLELQSTELDVQGKRLDVLAATGDPDQAAARLVEFGKGVAAAAEAAGY